MDAGEMGYVPTSGYPLLPGPSPLSAGSFPAETVSEGATSSTQKRRHRMSPRYLVSTPAP